MTFARNPRFTVQLEPYSLEAGEVGKPMFRPVVVSRHKSAKAARRALIRLITGTDSAAKDYLAAPCDYAIALRYVARSTDAPFKAYSAKDLEAVA